MSAQTIDSTNVSLRNCQYPDWFRDAKSGIWSHCGPQAVPRMGDWYAKKMNEEGSTDYKYHLEHYGHPWVFGCKDLIPLWRAERWNPEALMKLYKSVGARYFVSMGSHHENFFSVVLKNTPLEFGKYGFDKRCRGFVASCGKTRRI